MTPWTSAEDTQLLGQIAVYGAKDQWRQIAEAIPGRTNKACRKRWLHSLCPDVKKSLWTQEEDEQLLALHKLYPGRWAIIARHIQGRTDDACSKRYREALDPTLCRDDWSPEQDARLLQAVEAWSSQWSKVGQAMNRSGLGCRNRYRMLQRKMDTSPAQPVPAPVPQAILWSGPETPVDSPSTDCSVDVTWTQQSFTYAHPLIAPVPMHATSAWEAPPNEVVYAIDPVLQHPPLDLLIESSAPSTAASPQESPPDVFYDASPVQPHSLEMSYSPADPRDAAQPYYDAPSHEDPTANIDSVPDVPNGEGMLEACAQADDAPVPAADVEIQPVEDAAGQPPPAKRRRVSNPQRKRDAAEAARLCATRSVTADAAVLAYACGSSGCWAMVEAEIAGGAPSSPNGVRFATSAELLSHTKSLHPEDATEKIFRCALPGCDKRWKNINGLQYHLQVSRAHFQIAVNRVKCAAGADQSADTDDGRPKKAHCCPHAGCPNSYKQLSGLRYHLAHGHPDNAPAQLDELPPQLRRKLAAVSA